MVEYFCSQLIGLVVLKTEEYLLPLLLNQVSMSHL